LSGCSGVELSTADELAEIEVEAEMTGLVLSICCTREDESWVGDRNSLIRDGIGTTVAALLALPFDSALTTLVREAPEAFGRIGPGIGCLRGYSGSAVGPELVVALELLAV
jgi:hypothetical protein